MIDWPAPVDHAALHGPAGEFVLLTDLTQLDEAPAAFRPRPDGAVERLAGMKYGVPFRSARSDDPQEQLLLYAHDLRHVLKIEQGQRELPQDAYRETVMALANALESKDTSTGAHSQRVQRYAIELAREVDPSLLEDPGTAALAINLDLTTEPTPAAGGASGTSCGRPGLSTTTSAWALVAPTTWPRNVRPSAIVTVIRSAPSIT